MIPRIRKLLPLLAAISALLTSLSAEWASLFNGKNLEGWRQLNGKAEYRVEKGTIVGKSVLGTPNSFLATEKDYGDFILEFEFKVDHGLNSGVQFRSASYPEYKNNRVHGYQFEIDTSPRAWTGGVFDEARRGWLYPVDFNHDATRLFKANDWNKARIECIGARIRTFLNGSLVSFLIDDETASGFIALQVHSIRKGSGLEGTEIRWRHIRIDAHPNKTRETSPEIYIRNTIPNTLASEQSKQGWSNLFDGKKALGLINSKTNRFPEGGWRIEDGALTIGKTLKGLPKLGGDIVTKNKYAAFEFECEFKLTEGANSGIKYFVSDYENKEKGTLHQLGLEYQILDDSKHPDALNGAAANRTCASLYDLIPAYDRVHNRAIEANVGTWNHARIVALPDGNIEHWLNGYKVLSYERGSNIYAALVARSKYQYFKDFGLVEKGRILLQDHNDEVSYRSIRIREL